MSVHDDPWHPNDQLYELRNSLVTVLLQIGDTDGLPVISGKISGTLRCAEHHYVIELSDDNQGFAFSKHAPVQTEGTDIYLLLVVTFVPLYKEGMR